MNIFQLNILFHTQLVFYPFFYIKCVIFTVSNEVMKRANAFEFATSVRCLTNKF